jgi:hypothetical protein
MSTSATMSRPDAVRLPPEQRFWQRYSPHHEASFSGIGSFTLHFVVTVVLLLGGYLGWLGLSPRPPKISSDVYLKETGPELVDHPGSNPNQVEVGDVDGGKPLKGPSTEPRLDHPQLPPVQPPTSNVQIADPRPVHLDNLKELAGLNAQPTTRVPAPVPGSSVGMKPGPGSQGPRGTAGVMNSQPVPRALRWDLSFNTTDGRDYLRQLKGLGAVLAIPAGPDGGYKVVRELSRRPLQLLDEDVRKIPGICWRDQDPKAVAGVMRAFGLDLRPDHFAAFMPAELEVKLARLEREYAGHHENQIARTRFRVEWSGKGYVFVVVDQQLLP